MCNDPWHVTYYTMCGGYRRSLNQQATHQCAGTQTTVTEERGTAARCVPTEVESRTIPVQYRRSWCFEAQLQRYVLRERLIVHVHFE